MREESLQFVFNLCTDKEDRLQKPSHIFISFCSFAERLNVTESNFLSFSQTQKDSERKIHHVRLLERQPR